MHKCVIMLFCFLVAGCNLTTWYTPTPKVDWEAEKTKLEREYSSKNAAVIADLEKKQADKEKANQDNLHKASGLAYGILQLSDIRPEAERTRPDMLINLKSKEIVSRLPALTTDELLKVNEELKKELDEKNTTIVDLKKKYNEAMIQAEKDKAAIVAIQSDIDKKKAELASIDRLKSQAISDLNLARAKMAEKEANDQAKKAKDAEDRENLIKLLIKIFIGIGVAASIGAYAMRSLTLGLAAAGAFALSIFIAFVEPWVIITGGVLIVLAVVAGMGLKLYRIHKAGMTETDLSERLIGGIQNYKEKVGSEIFKADLGANLNEWIKDAPYLEDKIKDKLKKLNLL